MMTHMIEWTGFKRFELNQMIRFANVTEDNVNNILRRSLVIVFKSRCMDRLYIDEHHPDATTEGIFARDPDLKEKFKTDQAVAGLLRYLYAFWSHNSKQACLDMLEDYVTNGGDNGLTQSTIRQACDLPEKPADEIKQIGATPIIAEDPEIVVLKQMSNILMTYMMNIGFDHMTKGKLRNVAGIRSTDWESLLDTLVDKGLWLKFTKQSTQQKPYYHKRNIPSKGSEKQVPADVGELHIFLPKVVCNGTMNVLCPMDERVRGILYPETFSVDKLSQVYHNLRLISENDTVLREHISSDIAKMRGKRGVKTREYMESLDRLEEKLRRHDEKGIFLTRILDNLAKTTRRDGIIKYETHYSQKFGRSRAYVEGVGAQVVPRWVAETVCCATNDWDIRAAMFTLLDQIVRRLSVNFCLFEGEFRSLKKVANDRDAVCRDDLGVSVTVGKSVLNAVACGAALPPQFKGNCFLIALRREVQVLRWLAVTLRPELYEMFLRDGRHWPENSVFHYLWTPVEDYCIDVATTKIMESGVKHLSLHFDGFRVDRESCGLAPQFKQECEAVISEKTGYNVSLTLKEHFFLYDLIRMRGRRCSSTAIHGGSILLLDGNCIPAVIAVFQDLPGLEAYLQNNPPQRLTAQGKRVRSYADWHRWGQNAQIHLSPNTELPTKKGSYLLHAACGHNPHCVALEITQDGLYTVTDANEQFVLAKADFENSLLGAMDYASVVFFQLGEPANPASSDVNIVFLKLRAGVGTKRRRLIKKTPCVFSGLASMGSENANLDIPLLPVDENSGANGSDAELLEGSSLDTKTDVVAPSRESLVVDSDLKMFLCIEVSSYTVAQLPCGFWRCPFCPFRTFCREDRVRQHVSRYHIAKYRFAPSGTRQLSVIVALHDHDLLCCGVPLGNYLFRSAGAIRQDVLTPPPNRNRTDRGVLKKVVTGKGPVFHNKVDIGTHVLVRRVSAHTYADKALYEMVFRECVLCKGSMKKVINRIQSHMVVQGSELVSLLPTRLDWWYKVLEDVLTSCPISSMRTRFLMERYNDAEFKYCSIDATVKCCMNLRGQCNYRASMHLRRDQPIRDEEAFYRVLAVRGRTGVVLLAEPVHDESAEIIVEAMASSFSVRELGQIEHIAIDTPSSKLEAALQAICPRLGGISLDTVHLAMKYESVQWKKRTEGSTFLRRLLAKFNSYHPALATEGLGPMYVAGNPIQESRRELKLRDHVLRGTMSKRDIRKQFQNLDIDTPLRTREDFVAGVAAIVACFPKEVAKSDTSGKSLRRTLWNSTAPAKSEWMLNGSRYRHTTSCQERLLLPSGSTSNEALHADMKTWFHNVDSMFQSTLVVKLSLFTFTKQWAHNVALQRPLSRTMTQATVLHRVVSATDLWSEPVWEAWCRAQNSEGLQELAAAKQRQDHVKAIRAFKPRILKTRGKLKANGSNTKRRTPFTLRRVNSLVYTRRNQM